ncbi:MAG: hypothetical protein CVU41_19260 [Chloroflexi bacterium HGW-Chloroflexi-3]|nr:MAG: hypothetical protein CVU41_19260 [Chloroflexi bacterium HGW-Chloroflexi-3]
MLPVNKHRAENDNGEDFFFIADICSPIDVSQHAKTPPGRKRLFVKVQSYNPGIPGNKKEDHSLPIQKGA